jgi:hypothetical protein
MPTLNVSSSLRVSGSWEDGKFSFSDSLTPKLALSTGTGAGQADFLYSTQLSVPPDSTTTIDLTALPASVFGLSGSRHLHSVKMLYVQNNHLTGFIVIGEPTTNRWVGLTDGYTLLNPGAFMLVGDTRTGLDVTSSSKAILISNEASDSTTTLSGDTTNGGVGLSGLSDTTGLVVGMSVTGAGIPSGTTIAAIVSGTAVTLTNAATATDEGVSVAFQNSPAIVDVWIAGVLD